MSRSGSRPEAAVAASPTHRAPRRSQLARAGLGVVATCLGLLAFSGCRGPRDVDLERRVAEARIRATSTTPAADPMPNSAAGSVEPGKGGGASPYTVERRTMSSDEIATIMAKIPGHGPAVRMTLETDQGPIRCQLDADRAPQTVANVVSLALGDSPWRDPDTGDTMEGRFYDGLTFHRVLDGFIIQTGKAGQRRAGTPGWTLAREDGSPERFDAPGALAMVEAGEDSHGSQFFVTVRASKSLKSRYTAFGHCADAAKVRAIADAEKLPPSGKSTKATQPKDPVTIRKVRVERGAPL